MGNELLKLAVRRQQQASTQRDAPGSLSSVQQENNGFWGIVGSFRDQMNQAVQDGYEQSKRDNAEFDRQMREERQSRENRRNNGEDIEP